MATHRDKEADKRDILTVVNARGKGGTTIKNIRSICPGMTQAQFKDRFQELRDTGKIFDDGTKEGKALLYFGTASFPEKTEEKVATEYEEKRKENNEENSLEKIHQALIEISQETGGAMTAPYLASKAGVGKATASNYISQYKGKEKNGLKIKQTIRGKFQVLRNEDKPSAELQLPPTQNPEMEREPSQNFGREHTSGQSPEVNRENKEGRETSSDFIRGFEAGFIKGLEKGAEIGAQLAKNRQAH